MKRGVDVSVIIPTCRRPEYLSQALRKLLEVSALAIEIMVIDDSPDAEGHAVVTTLADSRIRYSQRDVPSKGRPALLRNDAARNAAGTVFYFLDDDDLVIPQALSAAYTLLRDAPEGVLLTLPEPFGANAAKVRSEVSYYKRVRKSLENGPSPYELDARLAFTESFVVPSACLIKRDAFQNAGGFDEHMPVCEDVALFAKAIASSGYVFSDKAMVQRRVGHSSLMADATTEALRQSYFQLRRSFRERHGALAYWTSRIRYRLGGW